MLAGRGCNVVLCSRSKKNGEEAKNKILAIYPDASVTDAVLDLASLTSVR